MTYLRSARLLPDRGGLLVGLVVCVLVLPVLAAAQTPDAAMAATLPRDLSPWGMFLAADIVVKAVLIGLAFASVLTWTIWFAKAIELLIARRRLRAADGDVLALAQAADAELRLSADALAPEGIKERIASRLERIEAAGSRRMIRGTGLLATVGATAPFVGLFGTVWGIMNSFIGIDRKSVV